MEFEVLLRLLAALQRESVEYALVGGVALNLHGIIRVTEDVDFFIRPTADNVDRLKRALRSVWNDPEIDEIRAEDLAGQYPTVRYGPPGEDFVIDLLASLGEAFQFDDIETETVSTHDVDVRIATPRMLYRMKRDTIRPIDHADAAMLRDKFKLRDD
jgi:hypothetical protein